MRICRAGRAAGWTCSFSIPATPPWQAIPSSHSTHDKENTTMENTKLLTLTFPARREEIIRFCKRHHYTHRAPGVWSVAYAVENGRGKIQAVAVYGPPPYPSVTR